MPEMREEKFRDKGFVDAAMTITRVLGRDRFRVGKTFTYFSTLFCLSVSSASSSSSSSNLSQSFTILPLSIHRTLSSPIPLVPLPLISLRNRTAEPASIRPSGSTFPARCRSPPP